VALVDDHVNAAALLFNVLEVACNREPPRKPSRSEINSLRRERDGLERQLVKAHVEDVRSQLQTAVRLLEEQTGFSNQEVNRLLALEVAKGRDSKRLLRAPRLPRTPRVLAKAARR
jgi:hypothetical protein